MQSATPTFRTEEQHRTGWFLLIAKYILPDTQVQNRLIFFQVWNLKAAIGKSGVRIKDSGRYIWLVGTGLHAQAPGSPSIKWWHGLGELTRRNEGRWSCSFIDTNSSERPPCLENLNSYYTSFSSQIFPAITFLKWKCNSLQPLQYT